MVLPLPLPPLLPRACKVLFTSVLRRTTAKRKGGSNNSAEHESSSSVQGFQ